MNTRGLRCLSRHFAANRAHVRSVTGPGFSRSALHSSPLREEANLRGAVSWALSREQAPHASAPRGMTIRAVGASAGPDTQGGGGPGSGPPKLVIFGGSGFLGSRISEEALRTGLSVVSISRSGSAPKGATGAWVDRVNWVKGDVFEPTTWEAQLRGAVGVISTIGAFGSNEFMYRMCGESNMQLMDAAAAAAVPRFAFISVHDYGFPAFVLPGYFNGKRDAEKKLLGSFPTGGVALRPGFIYGTRQVGSVGIPLQAIGIPLEKVTAALPSSLASIPLLGAAFVPPVSAGAVAKAAVRAVTDPSVPAGIMELSAIIKYGAQ